MILKICKSRENCEEKGKERIPNTSPFEEEFLLVLLFVCFCAAEVLLFDSFSVRGGWRRLPPSKSAGNDIVRELMGIA